MTKNAKIKLLKGMDKYIRDNINDEELFCDVWLACMPDEANEDDYDFIASSEESFIDCLKVFAQVCVEDNREEDF